MKVPKLTKRYCPFCKKHTEQAVSLFRTKARPATKKTALKAGVRRVAYTFAGYRGTSRRTVTPVKTTKKAALKFECKICKKNYFLRNPIRIKKVEFV
ncbi:MAG: 50S ribosomal protein L44e [DPANN group archaeon]|nr:50S ribosomal protein L44e [DPANN group archaeon]